MWGSAFRRPLDLHRDEGGTISILSVFAVLLMAMLLGMVMNVGREVNNKVQMQNAADAATYSGGVVMSRGMNTLAFTNHLLCDTFALTAFMREARDR
ncbi:MAG: Tad domain-containing protein, partial [Planctomycetes bacterium]|nr:Tad domain-containing protein [Planctomycetota bacterium]